MVAHQQTTFPNVTAFYQERGAGDGGELDFGTWWYETKPLGAPRYRVSVVHDTGDLYARNLLDGTVFLLGTLPGTCSPAGQVHEGHACAYEKAEKLLSGWADGGGPRPLSWVRERLS